MKQLMKKNAFIIFMIVFALIRLALTSNIPIIALPAQIYDDGMMVDMAVNIRAGNWLGDYTSNILVKGPFFPFLLAVINLLGCSYINVMNIIYVLACIYFVYTIKDVFKSKISLGFVYILLLFNPVSYAFWTLQRVYRNGITLAQVLIIIGSMFACYQRREKKASSMLPFAIIGGLTLASLWLTREDGIWILPFILVVIALLIISILLQNRKDKKIQWNRKVVTKLIVAILPMLLLILSLQAVKLVNYAKYGIYAYNEINDGYFGKVIKTMYCVKTDENIQYVTVTRNKIKLLYENSPTLKSIEPELEEMLNAWDHNDRTPGDTQVEDGWFWWALKGAVENAGKYENAQMSNEFYQKVYDELQEAIKQGKLKTGMSMPSTLMSPWKKEYFMQLPVEMAKTSYFIAHFNDVETVNGVSEANARKFNGITNDLSIEPMPEGKQDELTKYTEKYVERLNAIGKVYQYLGLVVTGISLLAYIFITIKLVKAKEKKVMMPLWLLLTGIGCSLLVLIAGVSYNHITACYSRYYMYLSGAYPLLIAFWGISISKVVEMIRDTKRRN